MILAVDMGRADAIVEIRRQFRQAAGALGIDALQQCGIGGGRGRGRMTRTQQRPPPGHRGSRSS